MGVRRAEVTLPGCLSRGSRGRDCCVLCVIYVYFAELYIILGFGLHDRCARDVVSPRGLFGADTAVWVRAWGVSFLSGACFLQISVFTGSWIGFP